MRTMEHNTTPTIKYDRSLDRATMAPAPKTVWPLLSGGCCIVDTVDGGGRPGSPDDFRASRRGGRETLLESHVT